MAGELAMTGAQVHEAARGVLRFWFAETPAEKRFGRDQALDAAIRARFGELREQVVESGAAGWDADPDTLLAAIILIDQFGRNLFRGEPRAFAADPIARDLTRTALRNGWDSGMTKDERAFLYLPLEHSEDAADQDASVAAFDALGDAEYSKYAHAHRDVIALFGRFPGRNAALGRTSTPEEAAYLSQPGTDW